MAKTIPNTKILTQSEVNKKIIAKAPKVRAHEDLLGPFDRYNDENFEIYKRKKNQFFEAAKKYNRMNRDTLICSRDILYNDYLEKINYDFMEENEKNGDACLIYPHSPDGLMIRKRTERAIHQVPKQKPIICNLEPWFKRHLVLNKFIWAARTVLIRNRMQKRLEILKNLDLNTIKKFEDLGTNVFNVSYGDIFQKFLISV